MRTEGCEARTLRALASMPFLDRTEMVAVTGWSKAALWERLTLLNRSQNWLAREVGVSPGYISMLVNAGRTPSGRIRRRMLRALGFDDFDQLFTMEDRDDEP